MSLFSRGEVPDAAKMNQKMLYIGATEPTSIYEGQLWYDTTNDVLKQRRGTSWVVVGSEMESNTDVYPDSDGGRDIGSASKRWKDLHVMEIVFSNASRAKIYLSSDVTISSRTWTTVGLNVAEIDSLGEVTGDAFYPKKNGYYLMYAQATFVNLPYVSEHDGGYTGEVAILKNETTRICRGTTTSSTNTSSRLHTASCLTIHKLVYGDYIQMQVWHNYTSSRTLSGGSSKTFLLVVRMV